MRTGPLTWEILCRVIDHYGDAGVAWRLARQLANEQGESVTLWIDDPAPLARLVPGVDPARDGVSDRVTVRRGPDPAAPWTPPDVLVDSFGGGVPAPWIETMSRAARAPAWIVLEYLSAERWVEDAHRRVSPEPRTGLVRHYWCPGFTPATGGLLRERDLLARRDAFACDPGARSRLLASLGVQATAGARVVLVFSYPMPALAGLLEAWCDGDTSTLALFPEGVGANALDRWSGGDVPHPGAPFTRGALTVAAIPFVPQRDFDTLLWSCDAAIVRGEDSFVRAQWAAVPFAWHAYPQDEGAHREKVAAFLDRYLGGADPDDAAAVRDFHASLDAGDGARLGAAWPAFARAAPRLAAHRRAWADRLAAQPDLASGVSEFVRNCL
ncbi:MAG: elongation factor P maturation arginine rhamnosyltransferase EarP [Betaproteobacteria bacterium]